MRRFNLVLCLVFVMIIAFTGCEKKAETTLNPKAETQTSSIKIQDDNNQNQQREVNEAVTNNSKEMVQSTNLKSVIETTNLKIEDDKNKNQEGEVKEVSTDISKDIVKSNSSKIVNDEINKQENKTPEEYKKYLGYWQLNHRDIKYNDVIRGFSVPLEIVSISNNIFSGSLSFRMTDSYHVNPGYTIKIQDEIKDSKVSFDFEDRTFGSGNGVITLDDDTIEVEIKLKEINENAPFSIEGRGVYTKIPEENLNTPTTPKKLFSYLEFHKKEMISELGKDYEIITIDHRAFKSTGYYYPKYGLTFDFIEGEENYVSRIICDETVDINGARAKMNFEQIQQYLGKGYVMEVMDERIPGKELKTYELFYRIYDTIIRFNSPYEDGKDSLLSISKS